MSTRPFISRISSEEFFEGSLDALDDDILNKISDILNKAEYPARKRNRDELFPLFEKTFSADENDALDTLMGGFSFLLQTSDDYDELELSVKELCSRLDDEKKKNSISTIFEKIHHWKVFYENKRLRRYKTKANSFLLDFTYLCDLRGRFKQDYEYDSTKIEEFKPELVDLVPILSLSFKVYDGANEHKCIFQVDEEELDEIIAKLLAAQKELKLLKQRI